MRPNYSRTREVYIEEQTRLFLNRIKRSEQVLNDAILRDFIDRLITENGNLKPLVTNYNLIAQLDSLYRDFISSEGYSLMESFIRRTRELFDINDQYFYTQSNTTPDRFRSISQSTRSSVYTSIGFNTRTRRLIKGGSLERVITDFTPINAIKNQIANAIANSMPIIELRSNVTITARGNDDVPGSLERHLQTQMPDAFAQFDRATGERFSTDLGLKFAIYQGGLIQTSRPFCKVRNNRVFSRDEISKFGTPQDTYGGYSNKSSGDFQGKCPKVGYNPFKNIGGCNCRHQYDWISDELAYRLRPELRPREAATAN